MLEKLMLLTAASLISVAGSVQAQTRLSADFAFTDTAIVLLTEQAQAAGYPVWREVMMGGPGAVPYNYCSWLLAEKPWLRPSFTTPQYGALENCANKISVLTQELVDASAPNVATSGNYWTTRPDLFTYVLPDPGLSEAEFAVFLDSSTEEITFVSDPAALAEQLLAALTLRVEDLETWQTTVGPADQVVTLDSLAAQNFLTQATGDTLYLPADALPEGDILTETEGDDRYVLSSTLPTGEILNQDTADNRYLQLDTIPEGDRLLTVNAANDLFLTKADLEALPTSSLAEESWWDWLWYWLPIILAVLLAITALVLWWLTRRKLESTRRKVDDEEKGLGETYLIATAARDSANTAKDRANTALHHSRVAITQHFPVGWEPKGDLPTQTELNDLKDDEGFAVRCVHDNGTTHTVNFTVIKEAFPQNKGEKQWGLSVDGKGTSYKPVALRVDRVLRECGKACAELDLHVQQPRNPETGQFAATG